MPVRFTRLRIAGFKSFAEPTTVEIHEGLTGIVGPNGCGKSNIVESLRWAMGETSAKSLRGGEMEDVIFAGTAARPARNLAEVTISLEETQGRAPPPLHEAPDLEISRRIERGQGSLYRINGREARARDVQTLFADLATGAHSSGMVSQGRIAAVVNARPDERRAILEEAAGITGLHARRHEAELKLRAAEANLSRAEDLRGQLESQHEALKRQARQAARYRNISGAVRNAEAELLSIQRAAAVAAEQEAAAAQALAVSAVAAATADATAAATAATEAAAALPPLRGSEAEARTALERSRIAAEQVAAEAQRAREALAQAERDLARIEADLAHAMAARNDAEAARERLSRERATLTEQAQALPARIAEADGLLTTATDAVRSAEAEANRATEHAATEEAAARSRNEARLFAEARLKRIEERAQRLAAERARIPRPDPTALDAAREEAEQAQAALAAIRAALEQAEADRATGDQARMAARDTAEAARTRMASLAAEIRTLEELVGNASTLAGALGVPEGMEAAVAAALGEALESGEWHELPSLPPPSWPEGAQALATSVSGPPSLARALAWAAVVAEGADPQALQPLLAPGQILVSREGAVWRWDGFAVPAGARSPAAIRIAQRRRLGEARAARAEAEAAANEAKQALEAAETALRQARDAETAARGARGETERKLERARATAARLTTETASATARLQAADEEEARLGADREEARAALDQALAGIATAPDTSAARAAVAAAREHLSQARRDESTARAAQTEARRALETARQRLASLESELAEWSRRHADAHARVADLETRRGEAAATREASAALPEEIETRRIAGIEALDAAERTYSACAAALQAAEAAAGAADRAARSAESRLAQTREEAVRIEAAREAAAAAVGTIAERVLERLGVDTVLPEPPAGLDEDRARKKLERLLRERDEMGPVNLRAEVEAEEIAARIEAIVKEGAELTTAIAKLRGSIGHLNREGRERLAAIFEQVDNQFQALFARLFGGGRAHLALVGSDDPLEAGLEIYVQPPGKKLATLSLLSGGEQALTALALIFAVFRCNPAPVAVLDEVDAPLDDANVERFCNLLEHMANDGGTRFLVVTHHPMTMARMDRLYGVTMQERGVSRLLSVDLARAAAMAEAAPLAAE
ncbi:MAG: AAA family ATPase [Rhodospirillales bacterium]|nr:AAA family ATPase [Rhodospirillales bacterium]